MEVIMRYLSLLLLLTASCGLPEEVDEPVAAEAELACADSADCQAAPPRPSRMWFTCGDPVCRGWTPKPGIRDCGQISEGDRCPPRFIGEVCDPHDGCNALLECRRDPGTGPCPISKAEHKYGIDYLSAEESERLRQELLSFKLATWHYNEEAPSEREHLGFIIDDVPGSAAVAAGGEHVNLYGYTTMAVATVQAQQRQLDAQSAEIAALKQQLAELRALVEAR
jgi:hypothetical protein